MKSALKKKPVLITQASLVEIKRDHDRIVALKKRIETLEANLAPLQEAVLVQLRDGAAVETGPMLVAIDQDRRRSVSWKGHLVRLNGQAVADDILAKTPYTITEKLVVSERA